MKDVETRQPGVIAIGAKQTFELDLYDDQTHPPTPTWIQDDPHVPNADLNAINIRVPLLHDVVKLRLPKDVRISDLQIIRRSEFPARAPLVGERLYIVGFPHGYSVSGDAEPTPVVLTRFAASRQIGNRQLDFFADGAGARGMSGGPVFFEHESGVSLAGVYTGAVFPDQAVKGRDDPVTVPEYSSALGTCCSLWVWFNPAYQEAISESRNNETAGDAIRTFLMKAADL